MNGTSDPVRSAGLVTREVRSGTREGKPTRIAMARRTYAAELTDVWDALTNTERLPRWFLPVSGDLEVGGRFQLEGNAGGVIESCQEPESLSVTWEYGGQVSWLQIQLSKAEGGTVLELAHEAHVDPEMWTQFGPGAVGVGWDLALLGLGWHLTSGAALDPAEALAWPISPDGVEFVRLASDSWAQAAIDDGDLPEEARPAAERTAAFYSTPPEASPEG
jgi:uncharacterized protein YndB with AHSA1/START domain